MKKLAVKVAIVAAMLNSSAHAAEKSVTSGAASKSGHGKIATVRQVPNSGKKSRLAGKKTRAAGQKTGAQKTANNADPDAVMKRDAVTETPSDSLEQTVQLRGVRG
jgi:hypothetical protein